MRRICLALLFCTALYSTALGAVPEQTIYETKTCDGGTTGFAVTGTILAETDVKVILVLTTTTPYTTTVLTNPTHYDVTVANARYPATGFTVTTVATYSSSYKLVITTGIVNASTLSLASGQWNAVSVQRAIERLTAKDQEFERKLSQTLKNPEAIGITPTTTFGEYGAYGYPYRNAAGSWSMGTLSSDPNFPAASTFWQGVIDETTLEGSLNALGDPNAIRPALQMGVYNVKDYPYLAKGDGTTNDTAAIKSSLAACIAAGGGELFFPKGTYCVADTLDATGTVYVTFRGAGMAASIIKYTGGEDEPLISGGTAWSGSESRGWHGIYDLQLTTGLTTYAYGTAIQWLSANPKFEIARCFIQGFKHGVYTTSDWGCRYRDNYISYTAVGLYLGRQPNCVQIDGNYFQRCETGIYASEAYQLSIRNCIIERKTAASISIAGGGPILVDGCYFEADLAGDTTIDVTRKSGISCSNLLVQNCHINNNSTYFIRGQAVDELRVVNNATMTPPENHVLVLSDTQTLSNGIKRCSIQGNTTLDYFGSGYDATLKKYLCYQLGASNPVKWTIGQNYEYTTRGTVYYGTMNAVADANITDMYDERIPYAAWNPGVLAGFAQDADSDAATATANVTNDGYEVLQLADGAGAWSATRYTRTLDLSAMRARFGDTGTMRLRLRCLSKNGYICVRAAGLVSTKADAAQYDTLELFATVDVNSATAYRIGYQVANGETGYFGPLEVTIFGTNQDRVVQMCDWSGKTSFPTGINVKNGSTSAGYIDIYEDSDNGTNYVRLIGPASTGTATLTLPTDTEIGQTGYLYNTAGTITTEAAVGFTNLTDFDAQTAWRMFYSDGSGDTTELALGANGTFLESNGAAAAPAYRALLAADIPGTVDDAITSAMIGDSQAIRLLASDTATMNGTAKDTIYTVPAGKSAIVTMVIIRNPSWSLAGGTNYAFGDGASADTWRTAVDLSTLTASTDCIILQPPTTKFTVYDAGDTFGLKATTGSTDAATATMMVYGIEF